MCQAEDIYQKLVKVQPTIMRKDKATAEELAAVWEGTETAKHNAGYGIPAYLGFLETYLATRKTEAAFTASGVSVGESKLFATLHILVSIRPAVLAPFPGLAAFYARFKGLEPTKGVLDGTLHMPGPFKQYFIDP